MSYGRIPGHPVNKFTFLVQFLLSALCDILAKVAIAFIANDWICSCGHQNTEKSIDYAITSHLVILCPLVGLVQRQGESRADIETEKIFIDGLKIGKNFLDLIDNIVYITFGKLLNPLI